MREYYRDDNRIQEQGPGSHDVIAFEKSPENAGARGGLSHFGFRLLSPQDIDEAVREVEQAGGTVVRRGEFAPGLLFANIKTIPTVTRSRSGLSECQQLRAFERLAGLGSLR